MARNSAQIVGIILIALGAILYVYPQNILGFKAGPTATCHPNALITPSPVPPEQNFIASGNLYAVGGGCQSITVYWWTQNSAGVDDGGGSVQAADSTGSPVSFQITVTPANFADDVNDGYYTLYASICTQAQQSSCSSAFNGQVQYTFQVATGANLYTQTITFLGGGSPQYGVLANVYQGSNLIFSGTSNSNGQVSMSEPTGTYKVYYFPTQGPYANGNQIFLITTGGGNTNVNMSTVTLTSYTTTTVTTCSTASTSAGNVVTVTSTVTSGTCQGYTNTSLYPLLPIAMVFSGILIAATSRARKRT